MQQNYLFLNNFNKKDNFNYNVDKNRSFLNIFSIKSFVQKV